MCTNIIRAKSKALLFLAWWRTAHGVKGRTKKRLLGDSTGLLRRHTVREAPEVWLVVRRREPRENTRSKRTENGETERSKEKTTRTTGVIHYAFYGILKPVLLKHRTHT